MHRLAGKSVLVTGASSGIGRAIALHFAAEGARLVLADITETVREGGVSTLDLLLQNGHESTYIETDVANEKACQAAVDFAVARYGRLDVLVNDAAISVGKSLIDTSLEEWNHVVSVNMTGVFLMSRAAVRVMLGQTLVSETRGRIVNISSQHGMICAPGNVAYGTTKAAVVYLTRQIAVDYAADGIICNAVAPGKIITGKSGPAASAEALDYSSRRTPIPRMGRPEDVASAALFLASAESSFITGENLMVDGGWMAA